MMQSRPPYDMQGPVNGRSHGPLNRSAPDSSSTAAYYPDMPPSSLPSPHRSSHGPPPSSSDLSRQDCERSDSFDQSADISGSSSSRKRQRIQQACKSCGIKRVKCDGHLPCVTCVRNGDACEYGVAKKRGPPKGSSRGPTKATRAKVAAAKMKRMGEAEDEDRGSPSFNATSSPTMDPLPPSDPTSGHPPLPPNGYSHQNGFIPPPHPGYSALPPPAAAAPSFESSPAGPSYAPIAGPAHASTSPSMYSIRSDLPPGPTNSISRASNPVLPSSIPLRSIPRVNAFMAEPNKASLISLPDPSGGPPRARFRGGTSGILDYQSRGREDRDRFHPNTLPGASASPDSGAFSGSTSPSSFALNLRRSPATSMDDHSGGRSYAATASRRGSQLRPPPPPPPPASDNKRSIRSQQPAPAGLPPSTSQQGLSSSEAIASAFLNGNATLPLLLEHPEVPESVEATVWQHYWQIIALHWPVLLRATLPVVNGQPRVDRNRQPLLYNAILALAAKIWDSDRDGQLPVILDNQGKPLTIDTLSDLYASRARFWLLRTDNEPSIEVAQALVLMSLRESGQGRSSSGAQYSMSACRVALDIGLHRNLRTRDQPSEERQARLRLFWCIYILDKTNAAMLGRPCVLRYSESDAPFFGFEGPEESDPWLATSDMTPGARWLTGQPPRSLSHLLAGCRLAIICEDIFAQYNVLRSSSDSKVASAPSSTATWDSAVVARLHKRLDEWHQTLPDFLQVQSQGPTFQHFLCQHMWWNVLRIILHRPYILKQHPEGSEVPCSHTVCTEAAIEVSRLVSLYKHQHGAKKLSGTIVYCVFTAGTILLANTTSPDAGTAREAQMRLRQVTEHLGAISGTWTSASLQLTILRHLGECLEADLTGTGLERVSRPADGRGGPDGARAEGASGYRGADPRGVGEGTAFAGHNAAMSDMGSNSSNMPAPFSGGGAGSGASIDGADIAGNVQSARSSLPQDRFFEIHDADYWGQMPLSSENGEAWAHFTARYLESLNSASAAAGTSPTKM